MKQSQSALEYMMTYGWAILIIVIVAGVLYSLGIFNPSASAGTTVTGFGGLGSVQAQCVPGGGLVIQIGNSIGQTIQITRLNTTSLAGANLAINTSITIGAGSTANFVIGNACSNSSSSRFSNTVAVTYTKPGQTFSGPFFSTGTVSGTSSKSAYAARFFNTSTMFINTSLVYTGTTNVTVAFWVKPEWTYMGLFDTGASGSYWSITDGSTSVTPNTLWVAGCNGQGNDGASTLANNTWDFVTVVMIKTSAYNVGTIDLYLNGASKLNWTGPSGNMLTGQTYQIGRSDCNTNSHFLSGEMSSVSLYNYTMSAARIKNLYSNGLGGAPITSTNGLLAWWPLDGNANDYSGNGNNGNVIGSVTWVSP